jgi:hypothetical protein
LVEGVHASTSNTRLSLTGEMMWPDAFSFSQPSRTVSELAIFEKSHGSRCPFLKPHDSICLTAHFAAFSWFGEPVRRGP